MTSHKSSTPQVHHAAVAQQSQAWPLTSAERNLDEPPCNLYHLVSAQSPSEACSIRYSNACLVIHIDERRNRATDGRGKWESQKQKSSSRNGKITCILCTHLETHTRTHTDTHDTLQHQMFHHFPILLDSLQHLGGDPVSRLCVKVAQGAAS